jgi:hypothetical protein
MHEPLFTGISLPLLSRSPWTLRRTPLLVGMERDLRRLPDCSEADGRDILRKLLQVPRRVAAMSEDLARQLLRLPGTGEAPVRATKDEEENLWFQEEKRTHQFSHRVRGAHASIPF